MTAQSRAAKAKIELEETQTAFDGLRSAALEAIATSGLAATETREKLYLFVHAIENLRTALDRVVADGEYANHAQTLAELGYTRP